MQLTQQHQQALDELIMRALDVRAQQTWNQYHFIEDQEANSELEAKLDRLHDAIGVYAQAIGCQLAALSG